MLIYLTFAVFGIELILDFLPSVAQVEHELARSTDNFIRTLSDDRNFSDRGHIAKLFIGFVIFAQSFKLFEVMLDVADHKH